MIKLPTLFITTLLCLLFSNSHAQQAPAGSIVMTTTVMSDNKEIADIMRFNEMEYYTVKLSGSSIKGKNYYIAIKEVWNGKIKNTDTIFTSKQEGFSRFKPEKDTLSFRVATTKKGDKKLRMDFYFDGFGLSREYKCTKSNNYSLRDSGTRIAIEPNLPFYAFAYTLPIEYENGNSSWCAVDASAKDMEKWGQELNIKHYLLVEMNFFE